MLIKGLFFKTLVNWYLCYQMIFNRSKNKYNLDKNVKALDALISLGS